MRRGTLVRWGLPVAVASVIGAAIGAGPVIAAVSGDPVLPERSAAQLLADAAAATQKGGIAPMSGTVQQTASLGLPALPALSQAGGSSPLSLLSGSHEVKVWYGAADKLRVAMPTQMNETNLIVNGDQVWYWESETNTATRMTVKTPTGGKPAHERPAPLPGQAALTPQQLAEQLLARVGEHTAVQVVNTAEVAGRPAYQLVITPKDAASLVREVRIALDGETYVPLQVQVYAKGSAEPAFQVGFTQVTFSPPAEENFTFTPPAGAKVEQRTIDLQDMVGRRVEERTERAKDVAEKAKVVGQGWSAVAVMPFDPADLTAQASGKDAAGAQAMLDTVLKSATPVSGDWGSGKVIRTKLVTVLLTDDGRLLAGAVTPEEIVKAAGVK